MSEEETELAPGDGAQDGSQRRAPGFISLGRIARPHGVHGEVQVEVHTDFPEERFVPGRTVALGMDDGGDPVSATIKTVRPHRHRLLLTFEGYSGREAADRLRGLYVLAPSVTAHDLPEDEFYAHEIIGLVAVTVDGETVGEVVGLLETGATDVLRVAGSREFLIPMSRSIVIEVDLDGGRVVIDPPAGLIDS